MRTLPAIVLASACTALATTFALPLVGGAPANATGASVAEQNIAVCDIAKITQEMLESERYAPARETERARLEEELLGDFQAQAAELEQRFVEAQENGDQEAMQAIQQQFMQLQQQSQQSQQEVQRRFQAFVSGQYREAYILIKDSASAIAEERGFPYVAASASADTDLTDDETVDPRAEILARSIIHHPDGTDITEDVRDDLNL